MNKIVVAVDFSSITPVLVEKAEEMAMCSKARVYIIHVAAPDPEFVGYKAGPVHVRESRTRELKEEKKDLEQLAEGLRMKNIDVVPLLIQGVTADLLVTETHRLEASLLILGSHGRGAALSALLGSTTHQVLHHVSCPVLLIPVKGK